MFIGRIEEIETIRRHLSLDRNDPNFRGITAVYGLFGAGKTTLLRKVREIIEEERLADGFFSIDEDVTATTLPEFAYHLVSSFQSLDPAFPRPSVEETDARRRRYLQIIGKLGVDRIPLLQQLRSERLSKGESESERSLEAELRALEVMVKDQFNNPDDQRLTLDTGNVMAEAMIVDMMGTFFPLTEEITSLADYLELNAAPKRIIIVIDTYEKITPLVNPWLLESLLPYLLKKRFGDFRSYRTDLLPDHTYVRDFFDVRFLIAGRERLALTDPERRWDRYRDDLSEIRLRPFSPSELRLYLDAIGLQEDINIERVTGLTQGLPYLVALWVDAVQAEAEGGEKAFVNALAGQRIFWYKTAEQQEWIRAAAFLDWFDLDALRCFETVGSEAPRAFEYLRNSSEVAHPSPVREGKFEIHDVLRTALRAATFQESEELALSLQESATAFYEAYELLERFTPQERELLRRLADFSRFDDEAVARRFGGEAHLVRELTEANDRLFERGTWTGRMRKEPAALLRRYNRHVDRERHREILDDVRRLWEERKTEFENAIAERREKIGELERKMRATSAARKMKQNLGRRADQEAGRLEAELFTARRRSPSVLSMRDVLVARFSFFFMILFLLLLFFADVIASDQETVEAVRTASLALALLFTGIFALMLGRILYLRSKRKEREALREDVVSAEERLRARRYEYHELEADVEAGEAEMKDWSAGIRKYEQEIRDIEARLKEPYV